MTAHIGPYCHGCGREVADSDDVDDDGLCVQCVLGPSIPPVATPAVAAECPDTREEDVDPLARTAGAMSDVDR